MNADTFSGLVDKLVKAFVQDNRSTLVNLVLDEITDSHGFKDGMLYADRVYYSLLEHLYETGHDVVPGRSQRNPYMIAFVVKGDKTLSLAELAELIPDTVLEWYVKTMIAGRATDAPKAI